MKNNKKKVRSLPYVVSKYFPRRLCYLVNRLFGKPIIGKRQFFASYSTETREHIESLHGVNIKDEIKKIMVAEIKRDFNGN